MKCLCSKFNQIRPSVTQVQNLCSVKRWLYSVINYVEKNLSTRENAHSFLDS
jgi:hypothetical protein